MSKSTIRTRAGLEPSNIKLSFEINTLNVRNYIADQIAIINSEATKRKGRDGKVLEPNPIDPARIRTCATQVGSGFAPILIMLPDTALKRGQYDENVSSMFRNEDDDVAAQLKPWYYDLLANWLHKKNQIDAIRSRVQQHALGITHPEDARDFIYFSKARTKTVRCDDGSRRRSVYVYLDPERLFHDMLIDQNAPNQRFSISVKGFTIVNDVLTKYEVEREIIRKAKGKKTRDMDVLLGRLASS